jgi:2-desacetyl-2-hydroxyethyl bacteriochlorophyllide A dehydrogenase
MKQIVLKEIENFISQEIDAPKPSDTEALVKIKSIGVCGTDLHAFVGRQPFFDYPRVLGHELGVEVVQAPKGCDLQPGDRCAIEPYIACGHCHSCQQNRSNCCQSLQVMGVHIDGGMQEWFTVNPGRLYKSDKLSFDQLALVETLGIGANAVKRSQVQSGQKVLIVGAGPIGLAVLQFALAEGADVTVLDVTQSRLDFAEQLGGKPQTNVGEELYEVVFDATGNKAAMEKSFHSVNFAGKLVLVGLIQGDISFHDPTFHRREMTLLSSRNSFGLFPEIISMIEQGSIDTQPWINHRLSLNQVTSEFKSLRQRPNLIKAVIEVT